MSTLPKYLMWFTRYGSPHVESQPTLEDCFELDWMLDNAETSEFDQYGCFDCVEEVGVGVIPADVYDVKFEAYKAAQHEILEAARASAPPRPPLIGTVEVRSVADGHFAGWVQMDRAYDRQQLDAAERDWVNAVGADRVRTRIFESAVSR